MQRKEFLTFGAIAVTAVLAIGLSIYISYTQQRATAASDLSVEGTISEFELFEVQTGEHWHSDNGSVKLLAFILINCPDGVCPMTMDDFSQLQAELRNEGLFGEEVNLVTITIDPERDTAQRLLEYASVFDADPTGWKFLRGEAEQIREIAEDLEYHYELRETDHPDGVLGIHAMDMYLIDADHQIRARHRMTSIDQEMEKRAILSDIRALVSEQ